MGNICTGAQGRRRHSTGVVHPPPPPPQPEMAGYRYFFASETPYPPPPHPNPGPKPPPYYQYPGDCPPAHAALPMPLQAPYNHHHGGWITGRYPYGPMMQHAPLRPLPPPPYVEHQKAVPIRNDVNLRRETLRIEPDEAYPGRYLVSFTFDAAVAGSITLMFFAKEGKDCHLTPMSESVHPPFTVQFDQGLAQKFRQPPGTGIDLSVFDEMELSKDKEMDIYPLAIKGEASPCSECGKLGTSSTNSQITQVVFEKDKGEYHVRVVKQILWLNGKRYELQEIYGIGSSVEGEEYEGNVPGKGCVICLSEPRDITVLPCRHMCMCCECAEVLRFQTDPCCPICYQPVERLLRIKVDNANDE